MPLYPGSQPSVSGNSLAVITSAYTASYGDDIILDTSGSLFTLTLPVAVAGKVIRVHTNNPMSIGIVLVCGSTINGLALDSNFKIYGTGEIIFYCTTNGNWLSTTIGNILLATSLIGLILSYSPNLYWRLQETSGTVIADTSSNGKAGTILVGTPTYNQAGLTSRAGSSSIKFNGNTRILSNSAFVGGVATATIILRFKTTYSAGTQCLLDFQNFNVGGSNYSPTIFMNSSGKLQLYGYPTSTSFTTNSFNDGNPHTLAITIAGSICSLYVDATLQTSISNYTAQSFNGYWSLGASNPATNTFFQDYLEEFAVIPTALTSTQIAAIHSLF
jgi:hypothetical protein